MAQVALDMGAEKFYNIIDLFGFRDKTGVDLPGETSSMVKDPENMGDVDLATTGYGQGIAITPLQVLCAVNCFGNDGVLMKPKIVKEIVDKNGNPVKECEYYNGELNTTIERKYDPSGSFTEKKTDFRDNAE